MYGYCKYKFFSFRFKLTKTKRLKPSLLNYKSNAEDFFNIKFLASSNIKKDFNDSETNQLFILFIL